MVEARAQGRNGGTVLTFADLDDREYEELLRLTKVYGRQARRCRKAKAYLAGCVMLGAVLEGDLIAMMHLFADDVAAFVSPPA